MVVGCQLQYDNTMIAYSKRRKASGEVYRSGWLRHCSHFESDWCHFWPVSDNTVSKNVSFYKVVVGVRVSLENDPLFVVYFWMYSSST